MTDKFRGPPINNLWRVAAAYHARTFRNELREGRFALNIPDGWDSLTDAELEYAVEWLRRQPDIRKRDDGKWEAV